jgi:hypothetical protein
MKFETSREVAAAAALWDWLIGAATCRLTLAEDSLTEGEA